MSIFLFPISSTQKKLWWQIIKKKLELVYRLQNLYTLYKESGVTKERHNERICLSEIVKERVTSQ